MKDTFERDFALFLAQKNNNYFAVIAKVGLRAISWVYKAVCIGRNYAFNSGWLTSYYPPIPVLISIGNIVAGGTGKTPLTALLVKELIEGCQVAILSRGYRAMAEHLERPFFLSQGEGPLYPASYGGDEPYMLAALNPQALVLVGRDRSFSAKMAARAGAEVAIIDDGMQHRWLHRDYDIALINAKDPFGLGYFLPRGFLRDTPSSLKRSHLIILTHAEEEQQRQRAIALLRTYSDAPIAATKISVMGVYNLRGEQVESLEGKAVAIFCGIAQPDSFLSTVESLGARIVASLILPDHGILPQNGAWERFVGESQRCGAECVVCTEKDRVKIKEGFDLPLPLVWVKISLEFIEGKKLWDVFLAEVRTTLDRFRSR